MIALRERLERVRQPSRAERRLARLRAIQSRVAALPTRDQRPADEILGYDEYGDCFAYGLAITLDAPLRFKGSDFAKTDVRTAFE